MPKTLRHIPAVIVVFVLTSLFSHADIFRLKDGRVVSGKVIIEDTRTLTIKLDGTGLPSTIQRDDIVERTQGDLKKPEQRLYDEARAYLSRRQSLEALKKFTEAYETNLKFSKARDGITEVFPSLQKTADSKFRTEHFQEAYDINLALYDAAKILIRYSDDRFFQIRYSSRKLVAGHQLIDSLRGIAATLPESATRSDREKLLETFKFVSINIMTGNELNNDEFFYYCAQILYSVQRYEDAQQTLEKALNSNPDPPIFAKINAKFDEIDRKLNPPVELLPTPAVPVLVVASPPPPIPAHVPLEPPRTSPDRIVSPARVPVPTLPKESIITRAGNLRRAVISYKDIPLFQRLKAKYKSKGFKGLYEEIRSSLSGVDLIDYGVKIVLFILLFWIVPYYVTKFISNKWDVAASQWRTRVKKFGLIAFSLYALTGIVRIIKHPRPKKRCPYCKKAIDDIEAYEDMNFFLCPHCQENIKPVYNLEAYIRHLINSLENRVILPSHIQRSNAQSVEKDAMLKLIRALIIFGVHERASDIHIEPSSSQVKIRFRVDGVLSDFFTLNKATEPMLASAIKVMAVMDISEKRRPQDGKISVAVDAVDVDVRINTSPTPFGEKISLRLLNPRTIMIDTSGLGLEGETLAKFEHSIHRSHGLVLVTGPTGSGKSTSLYVALQMLNTGDKNIVSLEDPIEYKLDGVTQMQVNPKVDFTFSSGLRSILRQDPDVILVGEIRDKQTADTAIEAAMTGHLVFSTLHTMDAATAFLRFKELGIDPKRAATATVSVIAQRLVRLNCPECKTAYKPNPEDLKMIGLPPSTKDIVFMKGKGCSHCRATGYHGRTGIFELLIVDDGIRVMFEETLNTQALKEYARKNGMKTLKEVGRMKAMQGLTTVEEIVRAVL